MRLPFGHAECVLEGIYQPSVEREQLTLCATRQNDADYRSAAASTLCQLVTKMLEGHDLVL